MNFAETFGETVQNLRRDAVALLEQANEHRGLQRWVLRREALRLVALVDALEDGMARHRDRFIEEWLADSR